MKFRFIIAVILSAVLLVSCVNRAKDVISIPPQNTEPTVQSEPETETETETESEIETETESETETEIETETETETETEPEIFNRNDVFTDDAITVNNSEFHIPNGWCKDLMSVMNYGYYRYYKVAFYVIDLESKMSFGYDADRYFKPACTRKAGLALSWYMTLEENRKKNETGIPVKQSESRLSLDDIYYYDGRDYLKGAGYIGRHGYGEYTIKEVLHYLLYNSDNTAYRALWRMFNCHRYKVLEKELGIPEYEDEYARNTLWTPMRAHDIGLIWQRIWEYKNSGSPEGELLWYELTHNEYCEIAKVVSGADEIAHKSGSDDYGFHEAGIVVRGDNAYVVVALSTVPLPYANDDYDCIHMVIERIDRIMQYYYSNEWKERLP